MAKVQNLGFDDVIDFGKHKGQKVRTLLQADTGYLAWLREEVRNKDGLNVFNKAVEDELDKNIQMIPSLNMKWGSTVGKRLPSSSEPSDTKRRVNPALERKLEEAREAAYSEEWGAW